MQVLAATRLAATRLCYVDAASASVYSCTHPDTPDLLYFMYLVSLAFAHVMHVLILPRAEVPRDTSSLLGVWHVLHQNFRFGN